MRPRSQFPKIYLHKPSGRDEVVVRDPDGTRKTIYLGSAGSAESQRRSREVLVEHLAVDRERAVGRSQVGGCGS